jgi:hypothetical protein
LPLAMSRWRTAGLRYVNMVVLRGIGGLPPGDG